MNKNELITAVSKEIGMTKKDVAAVTEAVLDKLTEAMSNGEKVQLVGFGTFEAKERAGRIGKNPRTGEDVKIDACKVPSFKAGKVLKESVNK